MRTLVIQFLIKATKEKKTERLSIFLYLSRGSWGAERFEGRETVENFEVF
jgi:hypothetical protein